MLVHWHDLSTAFVAAQRCAQNYACRVVRVNAYFTVKAAVFFNVALKQKHRSPKFRPDRRLQHENKKKQKNTCGVLRYFIKQKRSSDDTFFFLVEREKTAALPDSKSHRFVTLGEKRKEEDDFVRVRVSIAITISGGRLR